MTRNEIIEMARQSGFVWLGEYHSNLEDFAKLVAQHEREACAKVCENYGREAEMQAIGNNYAQEIRARGQA
jgi:hypothetical protein